MKRKSSKNLTFILFRPFILDVEWYSVDIALIEVDFNANG